MGAHRRLVGNGERWRCPKAQATDAGRGVLNNISPELSTLPPHSLCPPHSRTRRTITPKDLGQLRHTAPHQLRHPRPENCGTYVSQKQVQEGDRKARHIHIRQQQSGPQPCSVTSPSQVGS